jgi:signal transduction histidine kinase
MTLYIVVLALGGINSNNVRVPSVPWWLNLLAMLIIVLTFLPVHGWLRRSVNQLVYGQHDNPYAMLAQFNHSLDGSAAAEVLLPAIAATLAATLKLPYVAIETTSGTDRVAGTFGRLLKHAETVSLPLAYRETTLGTLHASARHPYEHLSADDLRLLADLARQVGITLHAAQLSDALQASREQLITAREEERRRIRRDLHDGLGPMLAGLRMQLTALRHSVRDDPAASEALIDSLRDDVRAATADIRRLVYDLRPPLLDEHGLLGAVRHLGSALEGATLTLDAPAALPPLPAAVEVAVYRIAAEAVQNVAKHAGASACAISLALGANMLVLQVADNGAGLPAGYASGVGLLSMRERAAELGGQLAIDSTPGSGTCVLATIPCKADI